MAAVIELLVVLTLWTACAAIGGAIGRFYNGQTALAAILGLLLGPIGWVVFLLAAKEPATPASGAGESPPKATNWSDETFVG